MTIDQIIDIAQRVHDQERMDFGPGSSRAGRNAHWARIIGIVHHGHSIYNPTPDPQWHLKDGGNGRPQSDDVVVSWPSRVFYDCVPNSGAAGYSFRAQRDPHPLPPEQNVYPPPVPEGSGGVVITPPPPPPPPPAGVDLTPVLVAIAALSAKVAGLNRGNNLDSLDERMAALEAKVDTLRREVIATVKSQSYAIDASTKYFGAIKGTISPKA